MTATDIARAAGVWRRWSRNPLSASMVAQSAVGVEGRAPRPMLVCPPPLGDTTWHEDWAGAPGKAAILRDRFEAVAAGLGMDLIDLGQVTRYSPVDGIHLDVDDHAAVGELLERTPAGTIPFDCRRPGVRRRNPWRTKWINDQ
jgi:hypothetical protein